MKKAVGVICLVAGTYLMFGFLMVLSILFSGHGIREDVTIATPVVGIFGVVLFLFGIRQWDWTRSKKIIGISSTVIGGIFLFNYLTSILAEVTKKEIGVKLPPHNFVAGIFGVIFLSIGLFLIIKQYKIDKDKKSPLRTVLGRYQKKTIIEVVVGIAVILIIAVVLMVTKNNEWILTVNGERYEMVSVPNGTFKMRCYVDLGERSILTYKTKTISSFYIGKYVVTVGQWKKFVEATGYQSEAEREDGAYDCNEHKLEKNANWRNPLFNQSNNHPVTCINWNDCQEFIKWLNEKTGKRFRLPNSAEWEYACRAGTIDDRYGNIIDDRYGNIDDIAWYNLNSGGATHPVGQKQPNDWGLFDMFGNVFEWCQDSYKENRIVRGSCWCCRANLVRSVGYSNNNWIDKGLRSNACGFRLASN